MKFLSYIILNGLFTSLLWFGLVEGVKGAQNVGLFIVWTLFILSMCAVSENVAKAVAKKGFSVPYWFEILFDLFIVGLLAWYSCQWSAVAYLFHMVMISVLRSNVAKIRSEV